MSQLVLIIEDEPKIARWVQTYFEQAGFETRMAHDGITGLAMARHERPDLIILDLMLPGMDGLDVCRTLRRESNVPIIMLTARADEVDRLIGLEIGADDYQVKPFSPRELVARARAVLRRAGGGLVEAASEAPLRAGPVVLDPSRHTVTRNSQPIEITPTEFALLLVLFRHRGRPLSREQLIRLALGEDYMGYDRTIDAHIKNLRRKLEEDPSKPELILTVFGVGYKLVEDL